MTPYKKLRSLSRPCQYLKSRITFKKLGAYAAQMTDNEAAEQMNSARDHLFKQHPYLKHIFKALPNAQRVEDIENVLPWNLVKTLTE